MSTRPPTNKPPIKQSPTYPMKPGMRRKRVITPLHWLGVVLLGILLSGLIILFMSSPFSPSPVRITLPSKEYPMFGIKPALPGERIVLVMGVDEQDSLTRRETDDPFKNTRTDTMMLVRVSSKKRSVSIVSIPRDSKVYLGGGSQVGKINSAHAIGGAEYAVETVEESFGIPVDGYIVANFSGVRELVDTIGGIDLHVEKRMRYRDRTANLHIDFQPGMQHLDGKRAEEYLRFRHDELGDIGRIRRQQKFITAVAKKLKDPWVLTKLPKLVELSQKYIQTDMTFDELLMLAAFAQEIDLKNIRSATLPGYPSGYTVSYWVIDPEPAQQVLDRLILDNVFYNDEMPAEPLKVGVLYHSDFKTTLDKLVSNLEEQQFEVVCKSVTNSKSTQIIEHTERVTDARTHRLQTASPALSNARLIFAPVGTTFEVMSCSSLEDYTIIIGNEKEAI